MHSPRIHELNQSLHTSLTPKKMYCMWVVASRWRLGAWYGTPQVLLGCFDGSTYIPHCVNMAKQEKSREKNQSTQLSWVDNGFTMVHKHSAPYPKFIKVSPKVPPFHHAGDDLEHQDPDEYGPFFTNLVDDVQSGVTWILMQPIAIANQVLGTPG